MSQKSRSEAPKLDLTVRFEVEFFAKVKKKSLVMERQSLRAYIVNQIRELWLSGLAVRLPLKSSKTKEVSEFDDYGGYNEWVVKNDFTIDPTNPSLIAKDDLGEPIQIASKKYSAKDPLLKDHISKVFHPVDRIKPNNVMPTGNALGMEINASTQLYVHIYSGEKGLPFPTLRRLAELCILFELRIDRILDDHVGYLQASPFARSNVNNIFWSKEGYSVNMAKGLEKLRTLTTEDDVANFVCPAATSLEDSGFRNFYKYNFFSHTKTGAEESEGRRFKKIEFRQHQGSVKGEEILDWVQFVVALVSLAHVISDEFVDRFVTAKTKKQLGLMTLFATMAILTPETPVSNRFIKNAFQRMEARSYPVTHGGRAGRRPNAGTKPEDWLPPTDEEILADEKADMEENERMMKLRAGRRLGKAVEPEASSDTESSEHNAA